MDKNQEHELKYNNDLLQAVFDSAPNGIAVMKSIYDDKGSVEDFAILLFNTYTLNWIGNTDYKGKRYGDVFPMVKETGILEKFVQVAETGVAANFERWYSGEGMNHWFRFTAVKQGELLVVTTEDITATKKTENALDQAFQITQKQQRLHEAVTNNTPDLVYVFNLDYRFTYANKALLSMWGRSWDDSIGRGLRELGYEEWHAAMHEREIDEIVATKKSIRGTVSFPHAEFGKRIYDYIFAPVFNEFGEVEAIAGTTRDITEIKLAEEAIRESERRYRKLSESLEQQVNERTEELQRSNEDLQQFAHVASHDLKEPVRKIKTFISRLEQHLDGSLDESGSRFIERIHVATNRMFTMIDGVLAYSTINASSQESQTVDLNEVMKNIETDLEVVIQKTGTLFQYDQLPAIEGTPVLLYQLFYNLINNSIKFAKTDLAPQITIASEVLMNDNKKFAKLTLTDNGIGFEEGQSKSIFDTFTRLNSKDQYEGTGLGLALCKKIVERQGGSISATGVPGMGATFTILLPFHQNDHIISHGK